MGTSRSVRLLLPRPLRALPADLAAVVIATLLVNVAVFVPLIRETPLRVPVGLVFVLFVPGYAFIAALFPEAGGSPPDGDRAGEPETEFWEAPRRSGIDGIERLALSFGLSVALVPLIGLGLNFTPWGIRLAPVMIALTAVTLLTVAVAAVRRWNLPEDERFRVPHREWLTTIRAGLFEPESRADGALNAVLVLSLLLAVGSVGYAVAAPPQGEEFSAIYLLTEDDDGELVAADYPGEFELGDRAPIVVGVDNHEQRTTQYTVVVVEQSVDTATNETVVDDQRELDRFQTELAHDETWTHEHAIEPTMTGDDVRLVWLLYLDGEVPDDPSTENAPYHVHLWVSVDEPEE